MAKTPELDLRENYLQNYIINGDMNIAQRNTSFVAIADGSYNLDRWLYGKIGTMVHTLSQDTDAPSLPQSGKFFTKSMRLNLTTPDTTIAAGDLCLIQQRIEGYNYAAFAQKPITISFWVKATTPGIMCLAVGNGVDRSYVVDYTINSSNTWEYKVVHVSAMPSSGTWNYTTGLGLKVTFPLTAGTNFQAGATDTWLTGDFFTSGNQINGVNTGATDFRITGVMLNEGSEALPFQLAGGTFAREVQLCQRYYEKSYDPSVVPGSNNSSGIQVIATSGDSGGNHYYTVNFKQQKRAYPAVQIWTPAGALGQTTSFSNNSSQSGHSFTGGASALVDFANEESFYAHSFTYGTYAPGRVVFQYTADAEL